MSRAPRRRPAALALATVLLTLVAAWASPAPAYACSCAAASDTEHAERADVVFTGTVSARQRGTGGTETVTFAVDRVFKGEAAAVQVVTNSMGSMCGLELRATGPHLVLADQEPSGLTSDGCSGTRPGGAPLSLGAGQPPVSEPGASEPGLPPSSGRWVPMVGLILAVGAATLVGASLVRRRTR